MSNELGAAHGKDDVLSARKAVSVTFFLLAAAAATLLAIGAVALPHVGWPAFFNVQSGEAAGQVGPAVLVAFTLGCLALPLTVADRIYNGQQRGVITQIWTVLGSAASLVGLLAATRRPGGLPWLFGAVVDLHCW